MPAMPRSCTIAETYGRQTMIRSFTCALALGFTACTGVAAWAADPLPSQTEKILPAALALEAAEAAVAACKAQGYSVTVTVADRAGMPKVVLVGDGARYLTLEVTRRKAYTAALWHISTAEFAKRYTTPGGFVPGIYDPELAAGAGGVPIDVGDETIGAIAAAGAPGGDKDEACAKAGLAKIADRLK
jgi:uncharacterized protein GlcG (DUF336 family)